MSAKSDEIRLWITKGDHDLGTAKIKIKYMHHPIIDDQD